MSNFFIDTRELRSFRLKYHTSEINLLLKNKKTTLGLCVTNSFTPNDRQLWRENKMHKDLMITTIPNQVGRFLFNDKTTKWSNIRNLFKGQIFLIKSKQALNINIETLKQFLLIKKFYLRLLFSKDQLYRTKTILNLTTVNITEKTALINLIVFFKYQLNNIIFLNTIPKLIQSSK